MQKYILIAMKIYFVGIKIVLIFADVNKNKY